MGLSNMMPNLQVDLSKTDFQSTTTETLSDLSTVFSANEVSSASLTEVSDEVSDADAYLSVAESTADEIIEKVTEKLFDEKGEEELRENIEDNILNKDQIDVDRALEETIDDLKEDGSLDATVVGLETGDEKTIVTEDGEKIDVELEKGEDFAVFEDSYGETVIVIDETLTEQEAIDATAQALSEIIEQAANDNDIILSRNFYHGLQTGFMSSILVNFGGIDVSKDFYSKVSEVTGEDEDEMATREINERRITAEVAVR